MKLCIKTLVVAVLALVSFGCAKQPTSSTRVVTRGALECSVVKVYDPASRTYVEEDKCNTEYGLRSRTSFGAGRPVVLMSPQDAALLTAADNPAAQRCQKYEVTMSDGSTSIEEECTPADARGITRMPAPVPTNLATSRRR